MSRMLVDGRHRDNKGQVRRQAGETGLCSVQLDELCILCNCCRELDCHKARPADGVPISVVYMSTLQTSLTMNRQHPQEVDWHKARPADNDSIPQRTQEHDK